MILPHTEIFFLVFLNLIHGIFYNHWRARATKVLYTFLWDTTKNWQLFFCPLCSMVSTLIEEASTKNVQFFMVHTSETRSVLVPFLLHVLCCCRTHLKLVWMPARRRWPAASWSPWCTCTSSACRGRSGSESRPAPACRSRSSPRGSGTRRRRLRGGTKHWCQKTSRFS